MVRWSPRMSLTLQKPKCPLSNIGYFIKYFILWRFCLSTSSFDIFWFSVRCNLLAESNTCCLSSRAIFGIRLRDLSPVGCTTKTQACKLRPSLWLTLDVNVSYYNGLSVSPSASHSTETRSVAFLCLYRQNKMGDILDSDTELSQQMYSCMNDFLLVNGFMRFQLPNSHSDWESTWDWMRIHSRASFFFQFQSGLVVK